MTQTINDNLLVQGNEIIQGAQDAVQLQVKGIAAQTQALQAWQDNTGIALAQVTAEGKLQLGDPTLLPTATALIEANQTVILPSTKPQRGWHSLGKISGALTNAITWIFHEARLIGSSGVSGLHVAQRTQLTLDAATSNTLGANAANAELRSGDFQTTNYAGSTTYPVGQVTGSRSAVSNAVNAYAAKVSGIEAAINNDTGGSINQASAFSVISPLNNGTISALYGLQIPDLTQGAANYAISTGRGRVQFGDNLLLSRGSLSFTQEFAPPSVTLNLVASTGNLGIGVYQYAATYITAAGETQLSNPVSKTTTTGNQQITISNLFPGTSAVIARKIYRTTVGGSILKLLTTLNDNTTTSFVDNIADSSLGSVIAPIINTSAGGIYLTSSSIPAIQIDQNNNVGIGVGASTGLKIRGSGTIPAMAYFGQALQSGDFQWRTNVSLGSSTPDDTSQPQWAVRLGHNSDDFGVFRSPPGLSAVFTQLLKISPSGAVGINTASPAAQLDLYVGASSTVGASVRGAASQTADLQQWLNSSGTVLASVNNAGNLSAPTGTFVALNSGNVSITGGIINGTTIGLTTPARGMFYSNVNATPGATIKSGSGASTMLSLIDGAATPHQWSLTMGQGNATDGIFGVFNNNNSEWHMAFTAGASTYSYKPMIFSNSQPIYCLDTTVAAQPAVYMDGGNILHIGGTVRPTYIYGGSATPVIQADASVGAVLNNWPVYSRSYDTSTTGVAVGLVSRHQLSSGSAAVGMGSRNYFQLDTTAGTLRDAFWIDALWLNATDGTRRSAGRLWTFDWNGGRIALEVSADGSSPMIGFLGNSAVARQAYGAPVGTINRAALNTGTATTAQVAQALGALITDLRSNGLLG